MPLPDPRMEIHVVYKSEDGRSMENILHFERTAGFGFTDGAYCTHFTNGFDGFIATEYKNVMGAKDEYLGCKGVLNSGGITYTAVASGNRGNGNLMFDAIPDQNAVDIQKFTTHPGRSGRGRWFIGCVNQVHVDNNTLIVGALPVYGNLAAKLAGQFTEPVSGDIWNSQHYSRKDVAYYNITGWIIIPTIKRQDKRLFRSLLSG